MWCMVATARLSEVQLALRQVFQASLRSFRSGTCSFAFVVLLFKFMYKQCYVGTNPKPAHVLA